ncbi:hypothetical protein [Spirosoma koreense]
MKNIPQLVIVLAGSLFANVCLAQHPFSTCSAAFLSRKMLVSEYTPQGKCIVPTNATGELTVNAVALSTTANKALNRIPFTIAIRDRDSRTLTQYSEKAVKQVAIQTVLANCRKGDHIVLLTRNKQYSLPHNEILVR